MLRLLCAVAFLGASEPADVVTGSIQSLQQFYVSPEVGARMAKDLQGRLAKGEFQSITDGEELARRLTADLREISHDQHLRVQFFATEAPPTQTSLTPSPEELESERRDGLRDNFGFVRVRRLPGNVGYLDIRAFHTLAIAGPAVTAAMRFVANTEALIIDLRSNSGGEPNCVTFVASYLFDEPVHLDTLVMRWPENHTQQYWTVRLTPRFGGHKPVYLLTSHRTFSGGEAFAYNLQALHRARIVGEATAGAAHLTIPIRVSEHFTISVPFGRSINPTTGADWEGSGVTPDVAVKTNAAAVTAYRLALDGITNRTIDAARKAELRAINAEQALLGLER